MWAQREGLNILIKAPLTTSCWTLEPCGCYSLQYQMRVRPSLLVFYFSVTIPNISIIGFCHPCVYRLHKCSQFSIPSCIHVHHNVNVPFCASLWGGRVCFSSLNLGWSSDLLWPTECGGRSDAVQIPKPRLYEMSHSLVLSVWSSSFTMKASVR